MKGCSSQQRPTLSPVLQVPGMGPHGQRVPYPTVHFKPAWGELRECGPPPGWSQPSKATISPSHFHPDPGPRPATMKAARQRGKQKGIPAVSFLNLDPITHLVGWSNEAPIIVDRQKVIVLIDLGAQVSSISSGFCEQMCPKVSLLNRLLKLEGTGRATILYWGYVKVNLQIPGIRGYNDDVMLLVILTITYAKKVPIKVGSKINDRAIRIITNGELAKATVIWRQAHFSVVMLAHSSFS